MCVESTLFQRIWELSAKPVKWGTKMPWALILRSKKLFIESSSCIGASVERWVKLLPWARSHLHSARSRPSHVSFTTRSSYPHLRGNSSPLGTDVTILGHLSHDLLHWTLLVGSNVLNRLCSKGYESYPQSMWNEGRKNHGFWSFFQKTFHQELVMHWSFFGTLGEAFAPGHITSSFDWVPSLPRFFHCPVFLLAPAWELFLVRNQCDNTQSLKSLSFFWHVKELHQLTWGIMKVMSTWLFVILTGYCHIGSQRGRVPTHVRAGWPGSEGGVGGAGPRQTKMWSSPGSSFWDLFRFLQKKIERVLGFTIGYARGTQRP